MFDCTFRHMCTLSWFVCVAWFGTQCSLFRLLLQYSVLPICDLTGTSLTLLKASGSESSQRRASAELLPEPKGPTQAPSAWPRGKALGLVACKGCHHPKLKSNVLATSWHTSSQSTSFNVGTDLAPTCQVTLRQLSFHLESCVHFGYSSFCLIGWLWP